MPVREKRRRPAGWRPALSRSLVSSRLTFAAKAGPFVPVAAEGTSETDWLPEERGFEPSVPLCQEAVFPALGEEPEN